MAGGNSVDIKALETALGQVTSTFRSLSDKMDASTNVLDAIKDILGDTNANIAKNTSGKSTAAKKKSTASGQQMSKTSASSKPIIDNLLSANSSITKLDKTMSNVIKELQRFSQNIQGGIRLPSSVSNAPKNVATDTSAFGDIKTVLNEIKDAIESFHQTYAESEGKTGDKGLDEKIRQSRIEDRKESLEKRKFEKEIKQKGLNQALKDNPGLADYLKRQKKEEKNWEKFQNKGKWKGQAMNLAMGGLNSLATGNINSSAAIDSIIGLVGGPWGMLLKGLKMGADIFNKEESFGRDYARTYGGGKYGKQQFMRQSAAFRNSQPIKYGYTAEDYYNGAVNFSEGTGREVYRQTNANIKSAIDMKRMGIEGDTLGMFDTFGRSLQSTDEYFSKLYGKAGSKGLSFKKMTDAIKSNLKMAQTYTFSKGVDGLQKMAETSTRLKYNMSEVARFAEKVNTVEGAIKTAANLSVLGGDFAQFSNPMGLLYEGLNDMEGLNDRMVKMFSDKAYFDKGKGQIEISSFDRRRMRSAAEAMGVNPNEMMNIAMNKARENIVEKAAGGKYSGNTLDYIKNLAQINKNGQAYIADTQGLVGKKGEEILLSDPRFAKLLPSLEEESKRKDNKENAGLGDVFVQTQTIYDFLDNNLKGVSGKLGALVSKIVGSGGMTASEKAYFANVRDNDPEKWAELMRRYGSRSAIKGALSRGELSKEVNEYVGGESNAEFINKDYKRHIGSGGKKEKRRFAEDVKNKKYDKEREEYFKRTEDNDDISTHHVGLSNSNFNEHFAKILRGESVLNRRGTDLLGRSNVRILNSGQNPYTTAFDRLRNRATADYLNTLSVSPSIAQRFNQSQQGQQKIAFEPITLTINGQFNVNSGNQFRNIPIDDIDTRALKKAILDTVTENIPTIMRKANILNDRGYDMEHDKFRGAIQGSYV